MFYRPGVEPHGLAHNPFKALVAPRPIGWISTLDADRAGEPRALQLLQCRRRHPADGDVREQRAQARAARARMARARTRSANIRATGEFVCSVVAYGLRDAMNASSGPYAGRRGRVRPRRPGQGREPRRRAAAGRRGPGGARVPALAHARAAGARNVLVLGEVVGVHIDEAVIVDGQVDVTLYQPVARLGYRDYSAVDEVFAWCARRRAEPREPQVIFFTF